MPLDESQPRSSLEQMSAALAASSAEEIHAFLISILTPAELDEVQKRWALVKALAEGHSQRQIAQDLGLSLCKITRGSRELKKEHSAFRQMLGKVGVTASDEARRSKPRKPRQANSENES
jgi:TrpR family trp operon transcriptional repressor